jgi:hypothetical protein
MKKRDWSEREGNPQINQSRKRAENKRILHWLRYCGPLPLKMISQDTKLPMPVVAQRLAELIREGYVEAINRPNTELLYGAVPKAEIERRKQLPLFAKVDA